MAKTKGPKTIELLHVFGSDIDGGQWSWAAELERQDDDQVYLVLIPTVEEGVEIEAPDSARVESGAGLFDQLSSSWRNYPDEDISEETWQEVARKVSKFDKKLGAALMGRLRDEYDDTPPVPPTAAEQWARRATWERTSKGRAMGYLPKEDIRRITAVRHFVEQYQAKTGELPQGQHLIQSESAPGFWATFSEQCKASDSHNNEGAI
jgi:hypothetical protein